MHDLNVPIHCTSTRQETATAPRIFLNVGGRARIPEDMPGIGDINYLSNTSILELTAPPRHLAVIGGSYIGLEYAQMFRRFGSKVTIVERQSRLIAREDEDISEAIRSILEAEGITVRTNAECIAFAPHAEGAVVKVDCTSDEKEIVASHVLMAVGRRQNTDDLGLEQAGIKIDQYGYIIVDDRLATNVPGIWALGDCNGATALSRIRLTTISKLSQRIFSMARNGAFHRVYLATHCLRIHP